MVQFSFKAAALLSLCSVSSFFAVAAPVSDIIPTVQAGAFDFNQTSIAYAAKRWKFNTFFVHFDYTVSNPDGSTTAIVRQKATDVFGENVWPVWNSYGKVDFDKDNKIVGFESLSYPDLDPRWVEEFSDQPEYFASRIPEWEKRFNAKHVLINGKEKYRPGYGYRFSADQGRAVGTTVFHFKRNNDSELITVHLTGYNAVNSDVTVGFIGTKKDNPWIL
ncbi:hypothetical protein BXZ70DRAFT_947548 [Cristinia sonorae]|uniref:Uncharacterized protein n=1 Tax=Cristinia sonorae TaxID=1940300 RepID=A0A8K0UKG7_9AGAR|nr:hypothetical protein BXZ70DRAFT_947548 [Cristinia sonorae]